MLFRDESIVVLDKPSGLAVHRGWARESDVLVERVRRELGRVAYPVHRLDRGTSGVIVMAFDARAARALADSFASGQVEKTYWALVRGSPEAEQWIDHPLTNLESAALAESPRVAAQTHVRRLGAWGRYALVEARPRTGRLHQIRRHLKHISCPIIGDVNYGKGEHNRYFRERHDLHRLFLHALRLTLPHPETGEAMTFEAPLPPELERVLRRLAAEWDDGHARDDRDQSDHQEEGASLRAPAPLTSSETAAAPPPSWPGPTR